MFTRNGRTLTAKGVKPICSFQQKFQSLFVFGAFSPIDGSSFLLEMPLCNSDTFQIFLNEWSVKNPDELMIMVLDNGAFHKAIKLAIPDNVALVFLPPYSPELNPAEKIWARFKRDFTNKLFKTLDALEEYLATLCISLNEDIVKSTCSFDYIFSDPFWSNI